MKTYRVVLVGYGPRGKIWSQVIQKNKRAKLIAICEINHQTKNQNSLKIPFYTKIEKAIFENNPDVIILSTPPVSRIKDLKICAKYDLPVLVEKPLAVNFKEAKNLVKFMNLNKLIMMVGLNFRYLPATLEKIKLINSNKVGQPKFARFVYERWRDGRIKRLNKYPLTMDQPMLWEQSIHHFDLIRFVYNSDVKSVFATTSNPPWSMYKNDTNVNAILELKNGIIINYVGNWQSNSQILNFEWRTECEKGIIIQKKQFEDLYYKPFKSSVEKKIKLRKIKMWIDDANLLLNDFFDSIKAKKNIYKINSDHLKSLVIVDACIKSAKTGKKIQIKADNY